MTTIANLISPVRPNMDKDSQYKFLNSVNDVQNSLVYFTNPTLINNSDFANLSAKGTTATTQADGDNTEFMEDWFVVGASSANYVITPTAYALNSTIASASDYFCGVTISTFNGNPFYFYQRISDTVRLYQNNNFTYGLQIKNNNSTTVTIRMDINTNYGTGGTADNLVSGKSLYLQPGLNILTSSLKTQSLSGLTVGSGAFTEFRLTFIDIGGVAANLEIYQIKCELGTVSTPLINGNLLSW